MTVRIGTLSNGLRVVSETMPLVKTVSVGVWVDMYYKRFKNDLRAAQGYSTRLDRLKWFIELCFSLGCIGAIAVLLSRYG